LNNDDDDGDGGGDDDDDDDMGINRAWENIRKDMKASSTERLGYYELRNHKPWSEEECSKF
jgi:hypothetical protein